MKFSSGSVLQLLMILILFSGLNVRDYVLTLGEVLLLPTSNLNSVCLCVRLCVRLSVWSRWDLENGTSYGHASFAGGKSFARRFAKATFQVPYSNAKWWMLHLFFSPVWTYETTPSRHNQLKREGMPGLFLIGDVFARLNLKKVFPDLLTPTQSSERSLLFVLSIHDSMPSHHNGTIVSIDSPLWIVLWTGVGEAL